jgi:DNA-binding NarL/FixJ family response regulator
MRILIADDQRKVRYALRVLLQKQPEVVIVGESNNTDDLWKMIQESNPDILIVDWLLPDEINAQSLERYREKCPKLSVIAMSGRPEVEKSALQAGADAFISKIEPPDRLLAAISEVQHDLERTQKKSGKLPKKLNSDS